MCAGSMAVKKDTANYTPDNWGVTASLAGAVDGKHPAVLVEFLRYAEKSFKLILAVFKGGCHHKGHVFVDTEFAAND